MEKEPMIGFCPLASGSRGNCIYLGTPKIKILIDAGISGKAVASKLASLQVDLADIDAIVVTHDHGDHIQGLNTLAFKYQIPVYANEETAKGIGERLHDWPKFKIFHTGEKFALGDLEIHPFSIQHDTLDPVAFAIRFDALKLGVCTDLGHVSTLVRRHLEGCHYLYVESNHQPERVMASARPMALKQRILSRTGHLSNEACGELLRDVYHADLRHVYLAHLSSECNTPEKALEVVGEKLREATSQPPPVTIAYQDTVSLPVQF